MTLKVQSYIVDELTGTMRKVFDILREDTYLAPHQMLPELKEQGINLSCSALEKIARDLTERGLAEQQGNRDRQTFRRAKIIERADKPRPLKAVEPIQPAAVEDRFLAICTEMVDAMATLRAENESLRNGGCTPEELAALREKAQQFDVIQKALGHK